MTIIGLTDNIAPRFPRIGKLRKGGEKTATGYGPDLDYFRFTSERPEIEQAFTDLYGEKPRALRVYLPHQTPEGAFPTWCEVWNTKGLVHRCDGRNMTVWLNGAKYERGEKPCMGGHDKNDPLNDAVGRLDVLLPEMIQSGFVGYATLETHGKHDMLGILAVLQQVYNSTGDLRGVEFVLRRVPQQISVPGFGKNAGGRSSVEKWLVKIEPAADWVRLQISMAHAAQMGSGEAAPQLGAGDVIDGEMSEAPKQPELQKAVLPKNGNGGAPQAAAGISEMTLEKAAAMKTPKGIPFADLTDEQLQVVVEKATSPDSITAAGLLLRARAELAEKIATGEVPF